MSRVESMPSKLARSGILLAMAACSAGGSAEVVSPAHDTAGRPSVRAVAGRGVADASVVVAGRASMPSAAGGGAGAGGASHDADAAPAGASAADAGVAGAGADGTSAAGASTRATAAGAGMTGGAGGAAGRGVSAGPAADGGEPVAVPSAGCAKLAGRPEGGAITGSDRIYTFPASYDGTVPLPLLLALHAAGNPNTQLQTLTKGSRVETDYVRVYTWGQVAAAKH